MNFKFDRTRVLTGVRQKFGKLDANQLSGLTFLLNRVEGDSHFTVLPQIAYFLATAWHETARTMQPIVERGPRAYFRKYDIGKLAKRLGNTPDEDGDGYLYRGRGYVQNTGKGNAIKAGKALSGRYYTNSKGEQFMVRADTFVKNPELLLITEVSYDDAIDGMFTGRYTGKAIQDYLNSKRKDYLNARRVINGTDCALQIAQHAEKFEAILQDAIVQFDVQATSKVGPIEQPDASPAQGTVTVTVDENKTEGVSVKDLAKHVSPDTLKSVGPKAAAKAGSSLVTGGSLLWSLGLTGKILAVALGLLLAVVVGIVVFEVFKHRKKIKEAICNYIKGDPAQQGV